MADKIELYKKGMTYYNAKDWSNAAYYLKQAAHMGHANALYYMGNLCIDGKGVPKDVALSILYYRIADEKGSNAEAALNYVKVKYGPVKRTYYEIDIKEIAFQGSQMRKRLNNYEVGALSELRNLNRNLEGVYPYSAYLLMSYGMEYYYRYNVVGNTLWIDKAVWALEECYGMAFRTMLEQLKQTI